MPRQTVSTFENSEVEAETPMHIDEEFVTAKVEVITSRGVNRAKPEKDSEMLEVETPLRRLQKYSPWLMVLDKHREIITFTTKTLGDKYFIKDLPISIRDDRICCSRYGWWLFYSDLRGLVFYNR